MLWYQQFRVVYLLLNLTNLSYMLGVKLNHHQIKILCSEGTFQNYVKPGNVVIKK